MKVKMVCWNSFLIVGIGVIFTISCGNTADITQGQIIEATGGTTAELQKATNKAFPGDTILIPEGTYYFNGSVSFEGGMTILGAGMDKTILMKAGPEATPLFIIDGTNGLPVTIGGFTMSGIDDDITNIADIGIRLDDCLDFHIYDVEMRRFGNAGILIRGATTGVVRKSRFINNFREKINNLGYGVVVYGPGEGGWSGSAQWGTGSAVYVEDSHFEANRHAIASNNGSRYVFRYNTVLDTQGNFQAIDVHGLEYGSPRGSKSFEIYGNTIDNRVGTSWAGIMIRGGDGVIFENTFLGGTNRPVFLANRTDGTHNTTEYPAADQTRKLYAWDNFHQGVSARIKVRQGHEKFFEEGRDFFNFRMPGYVPYTYPHPLSER